MSKSKAGKQKAKKGMKKAARSAPKKQVRRAAPAQQAAPSEQRQVKAPPEYPWNVIFKKGADRLPVTVSDQAHYERLCTEFGAEHVEVQS